MRDEDWPRHADGEPKMFSELSPPQQQAAMTEVGDRMLRDLLLLQEKLLTAASGRSVNH